MTTFQFKQVDVFTAVPLKGNPLAVVLGADSLTGAQMASFAHWTNLSETTFLLKPVDPAADYRVRIFTPRGELPFAGHPTLGSCQVWLAAGGQPRATEIVQECEVGLVRIRHDGARLAFAAPPLRRIGGVEAPVLEQITRSLRIEATAIRASHWVDNGPGWVAVMLASRDEVRALKPDFEAMHGLKLGVVAPWPEAHADGSPQFEVRAFVPMLGVPEDPVTGSLNAGLAQWLIGAGLAPERYLARQGHVLGRDGHVHVARAGADVWIGGDVVTCIEGTLRL